VQAKGTKLRTFSDPESRREQSQTNKD
jgi:ATP-binding cassette, sub-family E, member 1